MISRIDELIFQLQQLRVRHGNVHVTIDTGRTVNLERLEFTPGSGMFPDGVNLVASESYAKKIDS